MLNGWTCLKCTRGCTDLLLTNHTKQVQNLFDGSFNFRPVSMIFDQKWMVSLKIYYHISSKTFFYVAVYMEKNHFVNCVLLNIFFWGNFRIFDTEAVIKIQILTWFRDYTQGKKLPPELKSVNSVNVQMWQVIQM